MSFARVDGMRHQRFMLLLGTPAGRVKNIISALVGEPLRILTSFFLHSSWWTDRNQPAPLVQLLQRASVLGAVLQYLSSMFRGLSSRWQILWRQMGCRCLTEFCERYPEDALLVRRAVLAVSAAVWRRHVKYLKQWEVFMLGDERRADQDLNSWCVQLFNSSSCCFKFGLGRRLHDLMSGHQPVEQKVAKLLSWRPAIREATWLIRVSIAAVERVHAGNRKRTHPQSKFGLFAAHNINVEVQNKYAAYRLLRAQRLAAHREAVQDRAEESHSATSLQYDEEEARDFRNNHLRAQTALQLFRTDWMADQRLQNLRWNPAGPATWPTIRATFAALPSARLTHYENLAEASTSSARLARANFAQQARSTLPIADAASADRSHVQHDQQHDETSSEAIVPVDDPILPAAPQDLSCQLAQRWTMSSGGQLQLATCPSKPPQGLQAEFPDGDNDVPFHVHFMAAFSGRRPSPLPLQQLFAAGDGPERRGEVQVAKTFCGRASRVVTDSDVPIEQRFPDHVDYKPCCGSLCRRDTSSTTLRFQANLHAAWHNIIVASSLKRKVANVPSADLLLAHAVYTTQNANSIAAVRFASVAEGVGSAGVITETWTFGLYTPVKRSAGAARQPPFTDVHLRASRKLFIAPDSPMQFRSPLPEATLGALDHRDDDSFSELLLRGDAQLEPMSVCRVDIHKLDWAPVWDGGFDTVRILGIAETVSVGSAAQKPRKGRAGRGGPQVAHEPAVDFVALMDEEPQLQGKKRCRPNAVDRQPVADHDEEEDSLAEELRRIMDEFGLQPNPMQELRYLDDADVLDAQDGQEADTQVDMDGFVEDELPGCDQEEGLPPEQPQELPARDDDVAQAAQPAIAAPLALVQAPPRFGSCDGIVPFG